MATLMWEASRYATTPLTRAGHEFLVQSQDVGLILKYPGTNIASDFSESSHFSCRLADKQLGMSRFGRGVSASEIIREEYGANFSSVFR